MEHGQVVELVSASVDGEVDDDEQRIVDAHLSTCPSCRAFADDAARLRRRCLVQPAGSAGSRVDPERLLAEVRSGRASSGRRLARRVGAATAIGAAAAIAAVVMVGPSGGSTSTAAAGGVAGTVTQVIRTSDHAFDHEHLEIPVGSTVEWSNVGSTEHVLVQDTGSATVRTPLEPGANQDITFNEAGTYDVHCEVHPEMTATVTVDL
ncbi:MAG: zf-HC2 domain-containing protein [Actinobacteria bacterium]|nr:zf-HC2 domain-containing protein [Actinomycetota bacterium]